MQVWRMIVTLSAVLALQVSMALAIDGYTVTELSALPGFKYCHACGINDAGQIAGVSYSNYLNEQGTHAFLYSDGQMQDLYPLTGGVGINNAGQILGNNGSSYCIYDDGKIQNVPLGFAGGINNVGQVVGSIGTDVYTYSGGVLRDLGTLNGGPVCNGFYPSGINDAGQVVGSAFFGPHYLVRAFMYTDGQLQFFGGSDGTPMAINNAGQVVGTTSSEQAFLYSAGQFQYLTLAGSIGSYGDDINDIGQVVGSVVTGNGQEHIFLYSGGQTQDLGVPLAGCTGIASASINNMGEMAVSAYDALGHQHAFLLTPVPHPGDANNDGALDITDLGILAKNYDTATGATWAMADFNGDGAVDVIDLGILARNYDWSAAPAGSIPEPATLSVLALGGLALLRRRSGYAG